tara:strand:+ start:11197 stop:11364 length:168 start_codon:yes stop_codon:yes gene_type:complete
MFLIPTGVDTDNTHSDEYDVPKKVATQTPKAYAKQQDEFGLDLDDYIASIPMEKD